jgi:hypothetical protein
LDEKKFVLLSFVPSGTRPQAEVRSVGHEAAGRSSQRNEGKRRKKKKKRRYQPTARPNSRIYATSPTCRDFRRGSLILFLLQISAFTVVRSTRQVFRLPTSFRRARGRRPKFPTERRRRRRRKKTAGRSSQRNEGKR